MPTTVALIPTDLERTFLGQPAALADTLAGRSVLEHTLRRAASIQCVSRIILVHPQSQNPLALIKGLRLDKPIVSFPYQPTDELRHQQQHLAAARKWALTAWRGGLGSASAYDELLPAAPLADAMAAHKAHAALIARADWPLFDTQAAAEQLRVHLEAPDAMKLTFTQAPPGLAALVTSQTALRKLADNDASFGLIFGYNSHKPAIDPIGREANIAVPASVRDCPQRFIYDTPRAKALLQQIARHLTHCLDTACAQLITDAARAVQCDRPAARLPQQITLELTPRRDSAGPLDPQHHLTLDRPDLSLDTAEKLFHQLADRNRAGDTALMLGHLGDALLHPQWDHFVLAAHDAGILGIGIETDLLCNDATLTRILELPLDLIAIRLDADTAATYKKVHGRDRFQTPARNLATLIEQRRNRAKLYHTPPGLPWIVPKLVKTAETLPDMESFFERWTRIYACHPVIEPALTGAGLIPDLNPIPMAPPRRTPCRQLANRLTILADGNLARCDQDWLGRAAVGNVNDQPLADLHRSLTLALDDHHAGNFAASPLCAACTHWHRP